MKKQNMHIIMHLRINKKDIDEYVKNNINPDKKDNKQTININNERECAMMHSFKTNEPMAANSSNDKYFKLDSEKKK